MQSHSEQQGQTLFSLLAATLKPIVSEPLPRVALAARVSFWPRTRGKTLPFVQEGRTSSTCLSAFATPVVRCDSPCSQEASHRSVAHHPPERAARHDPRSHTARHAVKDIPFCSSVFARPEKLDANRAMPLRESRVFLHLVRVLQDSCRKFGQRPKPYVVARYRELPRLRAPGDIDAVQEAQVKRQIEFFHETCPVEAVILHLFPPQHRFRHRRSVDTHCGFGNVLHQV